MCSLPDCVPGSGRADPGLHTRSLERHRTLGRVLRSVPVPCVGEDHKTGLRRRQRVLSGGFLVVPLRRSHTDGRGSFHLGELTPEEALQ